MQLKLAFQSQPAYFLPVSEGGKRKLVFAGFKKDLLVDKTNWLQS